MKILLINLPRIFETNDFTTPDYFMDNFMKYSSLGLLAIATGVDKKHSLEILIGFSDLYSRKFYFNPLFVAKELWHSVFYPKVLLFKIKGGFLMLYKIFLEKLS